MTNSLVNPLADFEKLIQNGGIDNCYESFLYEKEMLSGKFISDEKDKFTFSEQDEFGKWHFISITFAERLNKVFKTAYSNAIKNLSDQLSVIISADDLKTRVISHLDTLHFLHQQIAKINFYNSESLIKKWLLKMISFLKERSSSLNISHAAFKLLHNMPKDELPDGLFDFKGKWEDLRSLFKLLCEVTLFSNIDTNEDDFIKVVYASNPETLDIKLKFNCTEEKAAYILKKMQPLFKNLNDTTLVFSNCFQTKQEEYLKLRNFHTARSKYKKDLSKLDERREIDEIFNTFKIRKR